MNAHSNPDPCRGLFLLSLHEEIGFAFEHTHLEPTQFGFIGIPETWALDLGA